MRLLDQVRSPADIREWDYSTLATLADEIRLFLIDRVSRSGGHLGPNLGVVELSLALHRVFDSPEDAIVWDTGHQAYVHKILTGRAPEFDTLRRKNGLSGYPSRTESAHDWVENSHASTALSYADGLVKARALSGDPGRVVAVVGDGSLTGGMAWEALNNIAAAQRPLVIVVNDNARSYSPTIGGLAQHLAALRASGGYERFKSWSRRALERTPVLGQPLYGTLHGVKRGMKDVLAPQGLFEDLGLKYLGPVDGHDLEAVERLLSTAREYEGPVIVHVHTQKGKGYAPAENDEADRFHGVPVLNPETGLPAKPSGPSWTGAFATEMVKIGEQRNDVVAISAAMTGPTGLQPFADRYPDRFYDVGIAEQHALASAAGLAMGGMHPVVAIYATFLNRAYDQLLLDVAAHNLPVTVALDRAGITGEDGASHHGMWDLAMAASIPNLQVAAPRDVPRMQSALQRAVAENGPTLVRYPKGAAPTEIEALRRVDEVDVIVDHGTDCVLVAIGSLVAPAVAAAELLLADGVAVRVVNPTWILPLPNGLAELLESDKVCTLEDGIVDGGVGVTFAHQLKDKDWLHLGVPKQFIDHASRSEIMHELQLDGAGIAESVGKWLISPAS